MKNSVKLADICHKWISFFKPRVGYEAPANVIGAVEEYADFKMIQLANHLRNNYQPLAPNQADWQRISDKKVFRIEEIIKEIK